MSAVTTDTTSQTVQQVQVRVDSAGRIRCCPDVAIVTGPDMLIVFDLHGEGFAFPASDAVVVTDGGAQFPIPAWTVSPTQAALLDSNSEPAAFSYTVSVVSTTTGERYSLDPRIVNET